MNSIDLIILVLFLAGVIMGYRRGFILQVVHLLGFIIAYIVAYRFFDDFSPILRNWIPYPMADQQVGTSIWLQMFDLLDMEKMFYSAIAFALLFFGTKIALQLIGHLLSAIALLPGLNFANRWLGAILGFVEVFIILFILVHVLMFVPWETGQGWLSDSWIANRFIESTPVFSDSLKDVWNSR